MSIHYRFFAMEVAQMAQKNNPATMQMILPFLAVFWSKNFATG